MTNPVTPATQRFLQSLPSTGTVSRGAAKTAAKLLGLPEPQWFIGTDTFKVGRGEFRVPTEDEVSTLNVGYRADLGVKSTKTPKTAAPKAPKAPKASAPAPVTESLDLAVRISDDTANTAMAQAVSQALGVDVLLSDAESTPYVPAVSKTFVPWGHYADLKTLVASGHFLPIMITGPSGNGKTEQFEQVCAALKREYVRVNITTQTDEDDLLGGFRLVNGDTKFALGPIPLAMLRGAFVNLDEVDLGGPALMCLQPVLEGKPLYLKKIGRYITPAPGFGIGATANTKGRGDDGRYAHTMIMNDAMLERFAVLMEQGWAPAPVERKIVGNVMKMLGVYDSTVVKHLVEFANVTRTNFDQQTVSDQIATRRLIHLVRTFAALGDLNKAVDHTLSRFDENTAVGFKNLWNAIHAAPEVSPSGAEVPVAEPVEPATV